MCVAIRIAAGIPARIPRIRNVDSPGHTDDFGRSLALAPDGSILVCGDEGRVDLGQSQNWRVAKLNTSGQVLWTTDYNNPANSWDYAYGLAVDASGSVYVAGSENTPANNDDWRIAKYGVNGQFMWNIKISNEESMQEFLPLKARPGQSWADAWFETKLPEDSKLRAGRIQATPIRAIQPVVRRIHRLTHA